MVIIIPYNNFTQQPLDKIQAFFGIDTESEIYAVIGNILSYLSDLPEVDRMKTTAPTRSPNNKSAPKLFRKW